MNIIMLVFVRGRLNFNDGCLRCQSVAVGVSAMHCANLPVINGFCGAHICDGG